MSAKTKRGADKRAGFMFRIDPELAERYSRVAERAARSRNQVMEMVLAAVIDLLDRADEQVKAGSDVAPDEAFKLVAASLLHNLQKLGITNEFLSEGAEWLREREARQAEDVKRDRGRR